MAVVCQVTVCLPYLSLHPRPQARLTTAPGASLPFLVQVGERLLPTFRIASTLLQQAVDGVWCMVDGVWCMVYGVWCMVYGVWCMVYGVWCMVYGVWCMVYGEW
jgi:hypothetical protein